MGDVIAALSSDQSFVPYRNNKLTMLMQDSLGTSDDYEFIQHKCIIVPTFESIVIQTLSVRWMISHHNILNGLQIILRYHVCKTCLFTIICKYLITVKEGYIILSWFLFRW